jgi:hypothetical protein
MTNSAHSANFQRNSQVAASDTCVKQKQMQIVLTRVIFWSLQFRACASCIAETSAAILSLMFSPTKTAPKILCKKHHVQFKSRSRIELPTAHCPLGVISRRSHTPCTHVHNMSRHRRHSSTPPWQLFPFSLEAAARHTRAACDLETRPKLHACWCCRGVWQQLSF